MSLGDLSNFIYIVSVNTRIFLPIKEEKKGRKRREGGTTGGRGEGKKEGRKEGERLGGGKEGKEGERKSEFGRKMEWEGSSASMSVCSGTNRLKKFQKHLYFRVI